MMTHNKQTPPLTLLRIWRWNVLLIVRRLLLIATLTRHCRHDIMTRHYNHSSTFFAQAVRTEWARTPRLLHGRRVRLVV